MEVHLTPETEAQLQELAAKTGRGKDDLVEDAMAGYLTELNTLRQLIDSRYDDVRSGRVTPIDGENAFASLRTKSAQRRSSR
jgi:predicted transcriptional regulator